VSRIFVDTSALITHLDADDPRHEQVRSVFAAFESDELVTHGYIVAESIAVVRRRLGTDAVIALLDDVLPAIELLAVEPAVHAAALLRYRDSLPTGTSFVDHVSFEVMAREGIDIAFALDADFVSAGFTLRPEPG
jgi:uncharacterized protein